jgi:hypothetical protein
MLLSRALASRLSQSEPSLPISERHAVSDKALHQSWSGWVGDYPMTTPSGPAELLPMGGAAPITGSLA